MPKEKNTYKGTVSIVLKDKDGFIKDQRSFPNLVVDAGLGYITSRMKDASVTAMSHVAVGSGSTTPAAGNTTLETEITRVALTSTTVVGKDITYIADYPAGTGTGSLQEAGILNAASGGVLLARTTFAVINKGASDTLQITWIISAAG